MKNGKAYFAYITSVVSFIGMFIFLVLYDKVLAGQIGGLIITALLTVTLAFMGKTVFTGYMQSKHYNPELAEK